MSALEIYNQRFADSAQRVFARALNGARSRGRNHVMSEHFIEALGAEKDQYFQLVMGLLGIDLGKIQTLIAERLENFPRQAGGKLRLPPATIALLKQAWKMALLDGRMKIDSVDLISALAHDDRESLVRLIDGLNADIGAALKTMQAPGRCAEIFSLKLEPKSEASVTFIYDEDAEKAQRG
jgi:ATP-dependent Clp protease ATP-binding subunit ClpA